MKIQKIEKGREEMVLSLINDRSEEEYLKFDDRVREIIGKVRREGDQGLFELSAEIDKVKIEETPGLQVTEEEIEEGRAAVDPALMDSLLRAWDNIRRFHEKQLDKTWTFEREPGVLLGQKVQPVENAGVYIPGGKAAYPSTALMNIAPAKIAGVKRIVMTTPPGRDGKINPVILAAASIGGVHEIYRLGGAQAIAALAYGTDTIRRVDKITGPGNIYVARAKKMVFGVVDIDMIAGPSEICIVADETGDPSYIAADLLSQAEHDEMAASILVTDSPGLAEQVLKETEQMLFTLEREKIARASIETNGRAFLVEDLESAMAVSNFLAPEHLELMVKDPFALLPAVGNAGAVFLGKYSPEPAGDYLAGPNHTLPTNGTARFASPLGVYDFMKRTSIICYSREALEREKDDIMRIAKSEGLTAHAGAIQIRYESGREGE